MDAGITLCPEPESGQAMEPDMPSAPASMQPARTDLSVFKSARLRVLASRLAKARANPRFSAARRTLSMGSSPTPAKVEPVIVSRDDALGLKAHTHTHRHTILPSTCTHTKIR